MDIKVTSPAFRQGEEIPQKYTCNGDGVSPPVEWEVLSNNVRSFVLISEDPDAPMGTFTHWVVYDLPPNIRALPERVPNDDELPTGGVHGINSLHKIGYMGPCPPSGRHRYFFRVFALDERLDLKPGAGKDKVLRAMQGHILGEGELMGTYSMQ